MGGPMGRKERTRRRMRDKCLAKAQQRTAAFEERREQPRLASAARNGEEEAGSVMLVSTTSQHLQVFNVKGMREGGREGSITKDGSGIFSLTEGTPGC